MTNIIIGNRYYLRLKTFKYNIDKYIRGWGLDSSM